jgi:chemotaxis-related protein WspD
MSAQPKLKVALNPLNPCWTEIGVYGSGVCAELQQFVHCRNCPVYSRAGTQLLDRPLLPEYRQERTDHFAIETQKAAPRRSSALLFRLGTEWLALPTQAFQEVSEHRPIHSLPHRRNSLVLGLLNVRGELLICVSLARFLGLECRVPSVEGKTTAAVESPSSLGLRPSSLASRLLVAQWDGQRLVFPVDEVHGIVRFDAQELKPLPSTVSHSKSTFAQAVLPWNQKAVGLLDAELLFSAMNRNLT